MVTLIGIYILFSNKNHYISKEASLKNLENSNGEIINKIELNYTHSQH